MVRLLRIAAASFCWVATVVIVALLMRSYWWSDSITYEPRQELSFVVRSLEGNLTLRRTYNPLGCTGKKWRASSRELASVQNLDAYRKQSTPAWYWGGESNKFHANHWIVVPHWLAAVMVASAGLAIFQGRVSRFSLRGAFATTTLLAILLGLAAVIAQRAA